MPNFLDNVKDTVSGLWKGKAQRQEVAATEQSPKITDPSTSHVVAQDESQEVQGISAPPDSKRAQGYGEHEEGERHKSRRISEDAKRLMGDYTAPKDAEPIWQPMSSDEDGINPRKLVSTRKMPGRIVGGFRPKNTLHQPPLQLGKGFCKGYIPPQNGSNCQLQTATSRGSNVGPAKSRHFDNLNESPDSSVKRRKVNNGTATMSSPHQVIDLADDEVPANATFVSKNAKGKRNSSQQSLTVLSDSQRNDQYQPFEQHESYGVDRLLATAPDKRKRRLPGANSRRTSETNNTSQDRSRGLAGERGGTKQQPFEVAEDHITPQKPAAPTSRTGSDTKANVRPPIDLEKGMPQLPKAAGNRRRVQDIAEANAALTESLVTQQQRNLESMAGFIGRGSQNGQTRNDEHLGGAPQSHHHREEIRRLSQTFVREEPAPQPQPRAKASQRMKATSKTSPAHMVSPIGDSSDELAGDTTIRSQVSRSLSPKKPSTEVTVVAVPVTGFGSKRSVSTSDMRPTQFSSSKEAPFKQSTSSILPQKAAPDEEEIRIPISAIYCRACVLCQQGLSLVWDQDSKLFYVESNGELQKIPGRDTLATISKSEASKWVEAQNSLIVNIKGSRTMCSSGNIFLEFTDLKGRDDCFSYLQHATGDLLSPKTDPAERMQAVLNNLVPDIQADHEKEEKRSRQTIDLALMMQRRADGEGRPILSAERIQYEYSSDEPDDPHSTARSRMQSGNLPESAEVGRVSRSGRMSASSPYFGKPMETRKSTRQSKPMKRKNPTPPPPERWTLVNKPKEWSHSVVYPTEGARRVTVDFHDLERLDEGEFLNDNIISFALRRIEENMPPEVKETVHFFNSFFYTSLMINGQRRGFNYDGVKKWTKGKDIFTMPFVVVPINIDLHWFLAIICNLPHLSRKPAGLDEQGLEISEITAERKAEEEAVDVEDDAVIQDSQERASEVPGKEREGMGDLLIEGNEIESSGVVEEPESFPLTNSRPRIPTYKRGGKKHPAPPLAKIAPDTPVIITLDSFGSSHTTEVAHLKDYVKAEGEAKRGMAITREMMKGITARGIPEQTNFCDCGLYLTGYVEEFAKDPRKFVNKVLSRQMDEESDFAHFDPSAKRVEIREALLSLQEEQEATIRAKRKGKAAAAYENKPSNSAATQVKQSTTPAAETDPTKPLIGDPSQAVATKAQNVTDSVEAVLTSAFKKTRTDKQQSAKLPAAELVHAERHATTGAGARGPSEYKSHLMATVSAARSPNAEEALGENDEMLDNGSPGVVDQDSVARQDTDNQKSPLHALEESLHDHPPGAKEPTPSEQGKANGRLEHGAAQVELDPANGSEPSSEPSSQQTSDASQVDSRAPTEAHQPNAKRGKHTLFPDD